MFTFFVFVWKTYEIIQMVPKYDFILISNEIILYLVKLHFYTLY